MYKITQIYFCLFFLLINSISFAKDIYVATNGNDTSGDGTIDNPFRTFNKAIDAMSTGDVCIIRGGIYEEELSITKNGTAGNYLTFKSVNGENVEIRATSKINNWQIHNGNIYKATVNMSIESRFRAVYHNDAYMDLARWPNNADNDRWTIDCTAVQGGDGSHFLVDNIPNIDWTGGIFYYLATHSGTSWSRSITSNTANRINHAGVDINKWPFSNHNPMWTENNTANPHGQIYLFNKLEVLDYAREWYYDKTTNTLYFQPEDGNIPADGAVEYATSKFVAELKGDYIKLEGLNFFGGSVKIHNNADNNQILNCKIIHGSEGHDDLTNSSAQVGESALEVLGDNTIIKGCTIDHSSVSGIVVSGWAASNCTIEGNTISNTDYLGIHASPIRSSGDNMKILKNTIFNAARDGMYVAGTGCEIAYNDVSASQKINSDSGVFYTVGNENLRNNEIHHNWFHDATAPSYSHNPGQPAKAAGIYLDNDSKGFTVHHNVVWNVSWSGYQVNWNNTHLDFYHNTIWNAERAMDAWVNGRIQENNKIYNSFANTGQWFSETSTDFDIQDSPIFSESPFEDADNQNFMPKAGSSLIDQGQEITGFDNTFKGNAPDIGAYERFGTQWTAGINAIEDTGEGTAINILNTTFTITTISETCSNKNNGKISISADIEAEYVLSFNGSNFNFIKNITLDNIAPDTYSLCISTHSDSKSQCFNVEIKEASELSAKSSLGNKKVSVTMQEGTAPFSVFINNNMVYETYAQSFSIDVNQGDELSIKSSKDCEGKIAEVIDFYGNPETYPNPTNGDFQLLIPINEGEVFIEIYDIYSRLVSSKLYTIEAGKIDLSIKNQPSGIYFTRIMGKNPTNVKVIKK